MNRVYCPDCPPDAPEITRNDGHGHQPTRCPEHAMEHKRKLDREKKQRQRDAHPRPPVVRMCKAPGCTEPTLHQGNAAVWCEKHLIESKEKSAEKKKPAQRAWKQRHRKAVELPEPNEEPKKKPARKYKQRTKGQGVAILEKVDKNWRIEIIVRIEKFRNQNRHREAAALHRIYFDTPYRYISTPARIGTGNKPG